MRWLRLLQRHFKINLMFFSLAIVTDPIFSQTLAVSPVYFDIQADPKITQFNELTVYNKSNTNISVKISVTGFWYDDKNKRTYPEDPNATFSAIKMVSFTNPIIPIKAGSSSVAKFVINTPDTFESSAYAVAFVETTNENDTTTNATNNRSAAVSFAFRIAVPILIASKKASPDLKMDLLKVDTGTPYTPLKLSFSLTNAGNVHVFPKGSIAFFDPVQKSFAGSIDFNDLKLLLPGQSEKFEFTYSGELQQSELLALIQIPYASTKLLSREIRFKPFSNPKTISSK